MKNLTKVFRVTWKLTAGVFNKVWANLCRTTFSSSPCSKVSSNPPGAGLGTPDIRRNGHSVTHWISAFIQGLILGSVMIIALFDVSYDWYIFLDLIFIKLNLIENTPISATKTVEQDFVCYLWTHLNYLVTCFPGTQSEAQRDGAKWQLSFRFLSVNLTEFLWMSWLSLCACSSDIEGMTAVGSWESLVSGLSSLAIWKIAVCLCYCGCSYI